MLREAPTGAFMLEWNNALTRLFLRKGNALVGEREPPWAPERVRNGLC